MNLSIELLPLARRSDPATSHQAAAEAKETAVRHNRLILHVLRTYGPHGKDRIAALAKLDGVQVARRLSDLQLLGLARPTGKTVQSNTGRSEREWEAV